MTEYKLTLNIELCFRQSLLDVFLFIFKFYSYYVLEINTKIYHIFLKDNKRKSLKGNSLRVSKIRVLVINDLKNYAIYLNIENFTYCCT